MKYVCFQLIPPCRVRSRIIKGLFMIASVIVFSLVFMFHSTRNDVTTRSLTLFMDYDKLNLTHDGKNSRLLSTLSTQDIETELERRISAGTRSRRNYTCDKVMNNVYLIGPIKVNLTVPKDFEEVEDCLASANLLFGIRHGGLWKPTDCTPSIKTAIVIPFRRRSEQLRVIVKHLHAILQRQVIHYRIFVIEQDGVEPWNKGRLINSAVKEIQKFDKFDCFVFNDIDMFAKNDQLRHDCPVSPFHMSSKLDQSRFTPPSLFGGVVALWWKHYEDINGFSNLYWKWGGEDDNMYWRLNGKQYEVIRPPVDVGRYEMMMTHHFRSDKWNIDNARHMEKVQRQSVALSKKESTDQWIYAEGLNTVEYNLTKLEEHPLYTLMSVILGYTNKTSTSGQL